MKVKIGYFNPHTSTWSVTNVFKQFHEKCLHLNPDIDFEYFDYSSHYDYNPSGIYSPHNMRIINEENGKFFVVSYWDKAVEMTWPDNGWNLEKCVGFITSSGAYDEYDFIPFSYIPYSTFFSENYTNAKSFEEKIQTDLSFKGLLYGQRLELSKLNILDISNDKITPDESYYEYLTSQQVCLSLNGAGEICNRDMEILSAGSVLLRPILKQKFHEPLIPGVHYIGYPYVENAEQQMNIILEVYGSIKNNRALLKTIAKNGYEWFSRNGTINKNVDLLKLLINFQALK